MLSVIIITSFTYLYTNVYINTLLDVEKNTDIFLTESLAMVPTAAVSGLYMAHPQSHYFGLGKINNEQVQNYAERKKISLPEAQKWLGPAML